MNGSTQSARDGTKPLQASADGQQEAHIAASIDDDTGANQHDRDAAADQRGDSGLPASKRPHPLDDASWISLFLWLWVLPLLKRGRKGTLAEDDVWPLPSKDEASTCAASFKAAYSKHGSLKRALVSLYYRRWVLAGCFYMVWCVSAALQPILVRRIVEFLEKDEAEAPTREGVGLALGLCAATIAYSLSINHKFHQLLRNGIKIRSTLMTALLSKSLRLATYAGAASGQTTNLMSNDTERIFEMQLFLHYLWAAPCFIVVVVVLMYLDIGPSAFIGFGVLILMIPVQAMFGRCVGSFKSKMMEDTDARTDLVSQVIKGIHVVKLYVWELGTMSQIMLLRDSELRSLAYFHHLRGIMRTVLFVLPNVVAFATIASYVAMEDELDLPTTFSILSYINILRFPLLLIPHAFALLGEGLTSLKRIEEFLQLPETPKLDWQRRQQQNEGESVVLDKATFSWSPSSAAGPDVPSAEHDTHATAICDTSLTIQQGMLVGVTGRVGTGKTAFLLSLLGEMHFQGEDPDQQHLPTSKTVYVPQVPVIYNMSLRDNIIMAWQGDNLEQADNAPSTPQTAARPAMGDDDGQYYRWCLWAACLEPDLELLPDGDNTELGEHGVNLSGGQKARVCFARALFHMPRANTVLMDDPLASVDAIVARKMFQRGLLSKMASTKTRIISMNSHVALLHKHADVLVQTHHSRSPDLRFNRSKEEQPTHTSSDSGSHSPTVESSGGVASISHAVGNNEKQPLLASSDSSDENTSVVSDGGDASDAEDFERPSRAPSKSRPSTWQLTIAEEKQQGSVPLHAYVDYFRSSSLTSTPDSVGSRDQLNSASLWPLYLVAFLYLTGHAVRVMSDVWITWWAAAADSDSSDLPSQLVNRTESYFIVSQAAFTGGNLLYSVVRSLICVVLAMRSSRAVHSMVLSRLLHAPLAYFQQTPPGRILNRFSTDLHRVDVLLPDMLYQFLDNVFVLFSAFILAVAAVPWLGILLVPVLIAYYLVQWLYRRTSRELLRMEAVTKSPIYSIFQQILQSRVTVRAFELESALQTRAHALINEHLRFFLTAKMIERWLSLAMNLVSIAIGTGLALTAVSLRQDTNPAVAGLALVYALQLMGLSSWTVKNLVDLENTMVGLERVMEVLGVDVEYDGPADKKPPGDWPSSGRIEFQNVTLRYRDDLEPALRGISLHIDDGAKIGICGRTGSGKSSIINCLFRLFEPDAFASKIRIDGQDTLDMDLKCLRQAMAIIPQDPVVFSGTLRYNLDPLNENSDDKLWAAVRMVHLSDVVTKRGGAAGLDMSIGHDGGNLSHGQKQLMCLARALLRPTRILVCDEATSSVDHETDALIQDIIRSEFKGRTVITIAHRLDTILDADEIFLIDQGQVLEHGPPEQLLQRHGSRFSSMVEAVRQSHLGDGTGHSERSAAVHRQPATFTESVV